jgi:hypothetical protein
MMKENKKPAVSEKNDGSETVKEKVGDTDVLVELFEGAVRSR